MTAIGKCRECGEVEELILDPKQVSVLLFCENHKNGCSMCPLIAPDTKRWIMRPVQRTDAVPGTGEDK